MFIILGGAHNGKRAYVEDLIAQLPTKKLVKYEGILPRIEEETEDKRIIISNFEQIVLPHLHQPEELVAQQIFERIAETSALAEVFCICTDTSRGIVPLEKEARQLRDTCGRLYQKLCNEGHTVVRVWYGIPQILKGAHYGQN
ncbi:MULTISPECIES: bifunctional adenosylcobinamide kinase/adenosylcobinamide-phosphate guanylyltransferase [Solibacillus]|uniref:Bifunctional adenosylcobinamide kinase/adenosylcobinamide-phosphate guanylyltransferase n=1 Tax=Solibacillus merdavium TaxID=2762218 RepID=A0ABR8XIZ0_9BACL|nr:bifunctional adenosylcobinamide kinase/adenosylcobinamide-phosphate guanylyltransferase [Solibacillus merdavium]MBD8031904.1 bifunctional adenosylcobinamide kinase/adenosylcobinamide-phosphate guanylyltransferase [Solibacillus merdavium]